jgi:hypothetical protein
MYALAVDTNYLEENFECSKHSVINGVNSLDNRCGVTSIRRMKDGSLTKRTTEKESG